MPTLPPLNYLRSFEAAARALSFTEAARELNLTQAAVSAHVRALEHFIGGPLFTRHARSLSLTSLGKAYLPGVQQALGGIEAATGAILNRRGAEKVVISCPVSLVEHWLAGAVARFGTAHPAAAITIHGRVWADEPPEIADIIITNTGQADLGGAATPLWRDALVAVAGPGTAEALACARFIHNLGRSEAWDLALDRLGVRRAPDAPADVQANTFAAALALAEAGHGVALVPGVHARAALAAGRLVVLGEAGPCPWVPTISDASLITSDTARELRAFLIDDAAGAGETPR